MHTEDREVAMETKNAQAGSEGTGEVITLSQAGKILHASYSTVRRLVLSGELKWFRIRNSWRTSTTACDEYIKSRFDEQSSICKSTDGI
jgi:excisionase family DNA binding protein